MMKPRFNLALSFCLALFTAEILSAETIWLDDLNLNVASQGWGDPHKNQSVEGHPLTIGGKQFARGFGTHAEGELRVNLAGGSQKFSASVGVDDEVNGNIASSLEFIVSGDGKVLWKSGVMRAGDAARDCEVDVAGVKSLVLEVSDAGDGSNWDHADWAEAKFETIAAKPVTVAIEPPLAPVAPYLLTPAAPATPRINGASVFGVRPNSPFLYSDGRAADEIFRKETAARAEAGCQNRTHHRSLEKQGRIHRHVAREKFARHGGKEISHCLR